MGVFTELQTLRANQGPAADYLNLPERAVGSGGVKASPWVLSRLGMFIPFGVGSLLLLAAGLKIHQLFQPVPPPSAFSHPIGSELA